MISGRVVAATESGSGSSPEQLSIAAVTASALRDCLSMLSNALGDPGSRSASDAVLRGFRTEEFDCVGELLEADSENNLFSLCPKFGRQALSYCPNFRIGVFHDSSGAACPMPYQNLHGRSFGLRFLRQLIQACSCLIPKEKLLFSCYGRDVFCHENVAGGG